MSETGIGPGIKPYKALVLTRMDGSEKRVPLAKIVRREEAIQQMTESLVAGALLEAKAKAYPADYLRLQVIALRDAADELEDQLSRESAAA